MNVNISNKTYIQQIVIGIFLYNTWSLSLFHLELWLSCPCCWYYRKSDFAEFHTGLVFRKFVLV